MTTWTNETKNTTSWDDTTTKHSTTWDETAETLKTWLFKIDDTWLFKIDDIYNFNITESETSVWDFVEKS